MAGSVTDFVHRGAVNSRREQIAHSLRVPVPATSLKTIKRDAQNAWETDSEVADTTITSFTKSEEMNDRYDGENYHRHDQDQYDESDDEDEDGVVEEMHSTSGPDSGVPNELQNLMEAPQRRTRWNTRGTQHHQNNTPSFQAPGLSKGALENLAKYRPQSTPAKDFQHSDGDGDEPLSRFIPKDQKVKRKSSSHTPTNPFDQSRSTSIDQQLPIQTKGTGSLIRHEQIIIDAGPVIQKEPTPITPIEKIPGMFHSQQAPTFYVEPAKYEQHVDKKASQSQQLLHEAPLHTDAFDVTDASAAMDDLETNKPNSAIATKVKQAFQPAKKRGADLDYSLEVLRKKNFSELRSQPFDIDSNAPATNSNGDQNELELPQKLGGLSDISDDARSAFFASLSAEEWEDCGDWFVTQFGNLVKKMKEARREKHRVMKEFEDEAEQRYKAVEACGLQLDKELREMKMGGMGVLKGRKTGD